MGGSKTRSQRVTRNHVLTEQEVLGFLKHLPEGATSVQVEDHLHGTHGYQILLDLQAQGKIHQTGTAWSVGTRKYPPT